MIILQLILYCGLFIALVRMSVIGGAINALYFYPKTYQEIAFERGIAEREVVRKKSLRFMIPFLVIMLMALLLIIAVWNRAADFLTAYLQSTLFFVVMNWFDGIVIDKLWVGHDKRRIIAGMEDVPYVKSWREILIKRGVVTIIYIILAAGSAGLSVLINTLILR